MQHLLKLPIITVPSLPAGTQASSPKCPVLKQGDIAIFTNTAYMYSRVVNDAVRFVNLADGSFFLVSFHDYDVWAKAARRWATSILPKVAVEIAVDVSIEDEEADAEAEDNWDGSEETMPLSLRHAGWYPGCPCCQTPLSQQVTAALKGTLHHDQTH